MENIKKQNVKGYILWESLLALSIFILISSLVLEQIKFNRDYYAKKLHESEMLTVAQMALESGYEKLDLNELSVTVTHEKDKIIIYEDKKEVLRVVKY